MIKAILKVVFIVLIWELLAGCASMPFPDLNNVPSNTFIGVAEKAKSVEDCRRKAIVSAGEQIALNISTEIQVKYQKTSKAKGNFLDQTVEDSYRHLSEIILGDVISNTKQARFEKRWGVYNCYIIVRYPPRKIEKLRTEAKSINELRRRIRKEEEKKFLIELDKQRKYYRRRDSRISREIDGLRETVKENQWIDKEALKQKLREKSESLRILATRGYDRFRDAWYQFKQRYQNR